MTRKEFRLGLLILLYVLAAFSICFLYVVAGVIS